MAGDEKDRLGQKLRDVERGREDQYFAQRDRELIEKLRRQRAAEAGKLAPPCPACHVAMTLRTVDGIEAAFCPRCGGVWLDPLAVEQAAAREPEGWLGRLARALRPGP